MSVPGLDRGSAAEIAGLADAAASRCGGGTVVVVRGVGRTSRRRAQELQGRLTRRGVLSRVVTPLGRQLRAARTLHAAGIGLVIDAGPGRGRAQELAGVLGVPVLVPTTSPDR